MPTRRAKRSKTSQAPAAKANTVRKTRRGGVGSLGDLLNMPMDIIHEILLCFLPQDLLNLSRTSKAFHAFLIKKSSSFYWKESLKRLEDAPPCPKELTEPAWIALIFSPICTACGKGEAHQVFWSILMRICNSCIPIVAMDEHEFLRTCSEDPIPQRVLTKLWPVSEIAYFQRPQRFSQGKTVIKPRVYLRSEVAEVIRTWAGFVEDEETRKKFVKEKSQRAQHLHAFQSKCMSWLVCEEEARTREHERVYSERLEFITTKLQSLGWGPELQLLEHKRDTRLSSHKLVRIPKPLVDRNWRTIQGELLQCMQAVRKERLKRERRQRLRSRRPSFVNAGTELLSRFLREHPALHAYGLNLSDLSLMPEFREILLAPEDVQVDEMTFEALRPEMDTIVEGWRSRACDQLRKVVQAKKKAPKDVDPVTLATTVFSCGVCAQAYLFFPDVLAHTCQRPERCKSKSADHEPYALSLSLRKYELLEQACQIVRLCGGDPQTMSATDMDELDIRLVHGKAIMTWRAAIIEQTQFNDDMSKWRIAEPQELAKAKEREAEVMQSHTLWFCNRCTSLEFYWPFPLESHVEKSHGSVSFSVDRGDLTAIVPPTSVHVSNVIKLSLPSYEVLRLSTRNR